MRQLATHTSGLEYEFWNADMAKYLEVTGHPPILSGLKAALFYPMMTDPGTRWGYGIGIDWLGQVVEKIDGRPHRPILPRGNLRAARHARHRFRGFRRR